MTLFPYSSFIWQGSDGTEILSHVSQGMGYNMNVKPSEIRSAVRDYRQADVHDEILMACGYGDGGGGVTDEMCERARRLGDLAGTPSSSWGRIDGFFEGLEEARSDLPAYKGELYLQYHRGVLTTHGDLKDAFRKAERSLQIWEAAHCATGRDDIDIEAWRRVVFAQFHDYIPGSSIPEVYDETLPELKRISERASEEAKRSLEKRGKKECLFNPLPIKREVLHKNKLVELAPLSGAAIEKLEMVDIESVVATHSSLSNGRLKAKFDANGRIRQLSVDGKTVSQKGPLGQLMLYPDQPHAFEAWDIDRSTLAMGQEVKNARLINCVGAQTSGKLSFKVEITEKSSATIHYTLIANSTVLQIEYEIDWQDPEHLLKVVFPTAYNGAQARFGDPFGSSLRSQQPGKAYDEAQWEVAGSRYAIVSDDGEREGLFVVSEAKYGWTARSGSLGLSLLRSAKMPTSARASVEGEGHTQAVFSDLKKHSIRLAVGLFNPNAPRGEQPAALADTLYTECFAYTGKPTTQSYLGLEGGDSLLPCWAKPESDGWTLRLQETMGHRGSARILLADGYEAIRTDLRGALKRPQPKSNRVSFKPYEVISLRIQKADA